jgi:hypothetical protein
MPLYQQAVRKAAINGHLGELSSLYTRVSQNSASLCSPNAPYNCDGSGASGLNICLGPTCSTLKYCMAHEYGHVVAQYTDGPQRGSYRGDEGAYNADTVAGGGLTDGICDSTVVRPDDDDTHAFMAREFIGAGYSEGFAHFISSAVLNLRFSTGEFVYYSNVIDNTGNPNAPAPCGDDPTTPDVETWCVPPYDVPLGNTSWVTWMDYECDPVDMNHAHFGTEWDWLTFFWSLWTGSPAWDVDEITPMWHLIDNDNRATLCCPSVLPGNPYPPASCTKTNHVGSDPCGSMNEVIVGKLWANDGTFSVTDSVTNQVTIAYPWPSTMRQRFYDVGGFAKVNY